MGYYKSYNQIELSKNIDDLLARVSNIENKLKFDIESSKIIYITDCEFIQAAIGVIYRMSDDFNPNNINKLIFDINEYFDLKLSDRVFDMRILKCKCNELDILVKNILSNSTNFLLTEYKTEYKINKCINMITKTLYLLINDEML